MRSRERGSSARRRIARAKRLRRRLADEAVDAVLDELGRPAGVAARDDRLPRRERLDRHEPVVLLERRKADRAAASRADRAAPIVGHAPGERDAIGHAEVAASASSDPRSSPSPRDHQADGVASAVRQRANQEIGALERASAARRRGRSRRSRRTGRHAAAPADTERSSSAPARSRAAAGPSSTARTSRDSCASADTGRPRG